MMAGTLQSARYTPSQRQKAKPHHLMRYPKLINLLILVLLMEGSKALASKKKSSRAAATARTSKGFGSAPLTFAQVVQGFKTRLPNNIEAIECPCGSLMEDSTTRRLYQDCCRPIHQGVRPCSRPLDVLRSRYSAFSYRIIPHIIATTHETHSDYQNDDIAWAKLLNREGMFDSYEFVALEHGEEHVDGDTGTIDFTVRLRAKDGQEKAVRETSTFLRNKEGVWQYASGVFRQSA